MIKKCGTCKRMFLIQDEIPPASRSIEHKGCPGADPETEKEVASHEDLP